MSPSVASRRVEEELTPGPPDEETGSDPAGEHADPTPDVHEQHEQGHTTGESVGLAVRLLVSPAAGRLRHLPPVEFHDGAEWVAAGQAVARVEQGREIIEVRSPIDARVAGILVRDGEPVAHGQPLVWLEEAPRRTKSADPPGDRR